jgi:preprotein translocase subunit SecD
MAERTRSILPEPIIGSGHTFNTNLAAQQAIEEGYKGAFSSIFDANVTTLIKVLILYAVGTGAIKGFAITTGIGVATSMFTAIVGTRAIVNLLYGGKRVKKLSI